MSLIAKIKKTEGGKRLFYAYTYNKKKEIIANKAAEKLYPDIKDRYNTTIPYYIWRYNKDGGYRELKSVPYTGLYEEELRAIYTRKDGKLNK